MSEETRAWDTAEQQAKAFDEQEKILVKALQKIAKDKSLRAGKIAREALAEWSRAEWTG